MCIRDRHAAQRVAVAHRRGARALGCTATVNTASRETTHEAPSVARGGEDDDMTARGAVAARRADGDGPASLVGMSRDSWNESLMSRDRWVGGTVEWRAHRIHRIHGARENATRARATRDGALERDGVRRARWVRAVEETVESERIGVGRDLSLIHI